MKDKFNKKFIFIYSLLIGEVFALAFSLASNAEHLVYAALVLAPVVALTFVFPFWLFVRWVASTAEKSGRSYVAFMLVAIFFPLISWIIVIMFKKPEPPKI